MTFHFYTIIYTCSSQTHPTPKKSRPKVIYQLQDSLSHSHSLLFLLFILHKRKHDHRNPNHNDRYKNVKVFRGAG